MHMNFKFPSLLGTANPRALGTIVEKIAKSDWLELLCDFPLKGSDWSEGCHCLCYC